MLLICGITGRNCLPRRLISSQRIFPPRGLDGNDDDLIPNEYSLMGAAPGHGYAGDSCFARSRGAVGTTSHLNLNLSKTDLCKKTLENAFIKALSFVQHKIRYI